MLTWQIVEEAVSSVLDDFPDLGRISLLVAVKDSEFAPKAGEMLAQRGRFFRIFDVGGTNNGQGIYRILTKGAFIRVPYELCLVVAESRDDAQLFCQKLRPAGTLVTASDFIHAAFKPSGPNTYRRV
jgi:hypothetical protein